MQRWHVERRGTISWKRQVLISNCRCARATSLAHRTKAMTEGMNVPGNSVSDVGERINGGAVREDRSPVKVAIL